MRRGLNDARWSIAYGVPLSRLWAELKEMEPSAYTEGFRAALLDAALRR